MSQTYRDPNEDRKHITGMDHALRVATLAERHGARMEMVFAGLVHDLARPLSDIFHGEVIAEITRDLVSQVTYDVLRTHGEYQAAYIHGYRPDEDTPWHKDSKALCAWEIGSFNKEWDLPLMDIFKARQIIWNVCGTRD